MSRRALSLVAAVALSASLLASPASARRTVIDQGQFIDIGSEITPCTIGVSCAGTSLGFSFDFGNGLTDQAYIYDRGIISFGQEIPLGVDANADFTTFGVPVIAPLYAPGDTGTAGPYDAFLGTMSAGTFPETLPNFGTDITVITFLNSLDGGGFPTPYIHLLIDASSGEIRFEFIHGQSFLDSEGMLTLALPDTAGTQMGYLLGSTQFLQDPPNIEGVNAFSYVSGGTSGGVPEPGTWAMMLLGFGAIGVAMRRRRAMVQPALA
jgi:PEP-CTERM motif